MMKGIDAYRVYAAPAGLAAVLFLFGWTLFRDLSDLSDRLGQLDRDSSGPPSAAGPAGPARIAFDDLDTRTVRWFGIAVGRPEVVEIAIPHPRRSVLPDEPPAKTPPPAEPAPTVVFQEPLSLKLLGVFLGEQKKEALVEMSGQKQAIALEGELNGWKLISMDRASAVFESSSGQRETVRIFLDAPLDSKAP